MHTYGTRVDYYLISGHCGDAEASELPRSQQGCSASCQDLRDLSSDNFFGALSIINQHPDLHLHLPLTSSPLFRPLHRAGVWEHGLSFGISLSLIIRSIIHNATLRNQGAHVGVEQLEELQPPAATICTQGTRR